MRKMSCLLVFVAMASSLAGCVGSRTVSVWAPKFIEKHPVIMAHPSPITHIDKVEVLTVLPGMVVPPKGDFKPIGAVKKVPEKNRT